MLSFKQYLLEVKRSPERAHKLLDYLAKKHKNGYIHTGRDYDRTNASNVSHADWRERERTRPELIRFKSILMDKLKPLQRTVDANGVRSKLKGTGHGSHGPITVVKFQDQHYVADGHHRWFAARLKGDKKIDANIVSVPLNKFQKRRKRLTGSINKQDN